MAALSKKNTTKQTFLFCRVLLLVLTNTYLIFCVELLACFQPFIAFLL